MRAHRYVKLRALTWLVCSCCGLVRLRNAATDKAAHLPCPGGET